MLDPCRGGIAVRYIPSGSWKSHGSRIKKTLCAERKLLSPRDFYPAMTFGSPEACQGEQQWDHKKPQQSKTTSPLGRDSRLPSHTRLVGWPYRLRSRWRCFLGVHEEAGKHAAPPLRRACYTSQAFFSILLFTLSFSSHRCDDLGRWLCVLRHRYKRSSRLSCLPQDQSRPAPASRSSQTHRPLKLSSLPYVWISSMELATLLLSVR